MPGHIPKLEVGPTKRLIGLGVVIALAYSAICVGFLWDTGRRDYDHARETTNNLIESLQSEITRNIEQYDLSLQAVVDGLKLPDLQRVDPALRQVILFDRSATARDLGSILVLNDVGNVEIESRSLFPRSDNYAYREYFQFHKNNAGSERLITGPLISKTGEYILVMSRRLNNPDGSFKGVVVGNISLGYFHRLLGKIKLGPDDVLTVLRSDGTLLMRSPFDIQTIGRNLSHTPIFKQISSSQSGAIDAASSLDGVRRLYVYRHLDESPIIVLVGLSYAALYADWWREAWVIGALNLTLCVITMSLVIFLARALRRKTIAEYETAVMAATDGLTGICNRRRFDELLDTEWRRSARAQTSIALLMIDADCFKDFNDRHGHQAGDLALVALAQCISAGAKRAADVSARYGGEEFAVLLPGETVKGAMHIAEEIRASIIALRAQQEGRPDMTPTISVGVASMVPGVGLSSGDLVKSADAALYQAKRQGRNCCVSTAAVATIEKKKIAA